MSCVSEGLSGANRPRERGTIFCKAAHKMRQQVESMLLVVPGKVGKTVRDSEGEKCHLASCDPLSSSPSPAFKETLEAVESVDNSEGDGDNDDYSESVASECSVESECGECDGVSPSHEDGGDSPSNEEKNIKRCPSGASIVTYDEAASKLPEEGDCERTNDRKISRRADRSQSDEFQDDEQETRIDSSQRMAGSTGPAWTDDKHVSYLNSIEQTFVQSLYGQDYVTVDAPGQDDQDCVESRPMYGTRNGCELFTSLQRGCYDQREYYKPQFLHNFGPSTSAVFLSPWIQHFNPRTATPSTGTAGAGHDAETGIPSTWLVDGAYGVGNFGNGDVKEEVKESIPNLNNADTGSQVPQFWSNRYQSQHHASTSGHVRADGGVQTKKRNCNVDPGHDSGYRPKKLKSTQRWLAEIDLEMEEEFILKQKHQKESAECSDVKEEPQPFGVSGGFDLNQQLVDEETEPEDPKQKTPRPVAKTADYISSFKDPIVNSVKEECPSEVAIRMKPYQTSSHQRASISRPLEGDVEEGTSGVNKFVESISYAAAPANLLKARLDEVYPNHQADLDEDEEFEFLLRRSPRASKTYTWGTVGPRRLLQNECNVLVESAAHSGSVKGNRDHELRKEGNCE